MSCEKISVIQETMPSLTQLFFKCQYETIRIKMVMEVRTCLRKKKCGKRWGLGPVMQHGKRLAGLIYS